MYSVDITNKDEKSAKLLRQIAGLGIIECVSIVKGLQCMTLTDLINWTIDNMASNVRFLLIV